MCSQSNAVNYVRVNDEIKYLRFCDQISSYFTCRLLKPDAHKWRIKCRSFNILPSN